MISMHPQKNISLESITYHYVQRRMGPKGHKSAEDVRGWIQKSFILLSTLYLKMMV